MKNPIKNPILSYFIRFSITAPVASSYFIIPCRWSPYFTDSWEPKKWCGQHQLINVSKYHEHSINVSKYKRYIKYGIIMLI